MCLFGAADSTVAVKESVYIKFALKTDHLAGDFDQNPFLQS